MNVLLARFVARMGRAYYAASKFAVEAIHEALSQEVATFGIKVLIVEPGAFRTPFCMRLLTPAAHEATGGVSEAYKGTPLEQVVTMSKGITEIPTELMRGSPDKAAREVLKAVADGHDYLRMVLGPDCVVALEQKLESLHHDLEATRAIAMSTDADAGSS